jgi:hypothetical protein
MNYGITKPPDLNLGTNKPILGPIEVTGIIATSAGAGGFFDPSIANSYYTTAVGQSFAPPAIDTTSLGRGSYTLTWGAGTGVYALSSSQTQDGFTVTHEYKVEARQTLGGLTTDIILTSWRVMVKFIPAGANATMLTIQNALLAGGAGGLGSSKNQLQGGRLGQVAADVTLTGASGTYLSQTDLTPVIVLKNASLKTAGFVFGNKPLRNGELGFVTTWGSTGPAGGATAANAPVLMTLT